MANNKKELVVKANRLIEAGYRLDLVEQRVILFAITMARKTQKGIDANSFVEVSAKEYAMLYGVTPKKAYEQFKEIAKTLFHREFTLYDSDVNGNERKIESRWVSAIRYTDEIGKLEIMFSGVIIPYIIRLEAEFTKYALGQIAGMTSAYAIRLYELLIQWGNLRSREVEIEWLKKIFMIEGQYESIKDLKLRVIDLAVFQINEHSDLTVEYTQRKTGRNVTHLIFTFKKKEEQKPVESKPIVESKPVVESKPAVESKPIVESKPLPKPTVESKPLPTEVSHDCFSAATVMISKVVQDKLLKIRTPGEIRQCIAIANQKMERGEKIKNLGGYYATAIKEGWHLEQKESQKKNNDEKLRRENERKERERLADIAHMKMLSEMSGTPLELLLPSYVSQQ